MRAAALLAFALLAACVGEVVAVDGPVQVDGGAAPSQCGNGVVEPGEVCDDGRNDARDGGCLPGCRAEDRSDELFARPLVDVAISMDPVEWDVLRREAKPRHALLGGAGCRAAPWPAFYTWHPGSVVIDGVAVGRVGVRKKGLIGSQVERRPGLRIDFGRYVNNQRFLGLDGFSLNNNRSDPSLIRQCVGYSVFAAAGLPASRCTLARVTVNGEVQGVYTLLEEVAQHYLTRRFHDGTGNLYEGSLSDFRAEFVDSYDRETNKKNPDRSDLSAVVAALEAPDEALVGKLEPLIDLDALYRYWAAETLIWHRDGFSGNINNHYWYANPDKGGRFTLMPWGIDSALNPNSAAGLPDSVMSYSLLTSRLYFIPAQRDRYYAALDDLLAKAWDPAALLAQAARLGEIAEPLLTTEQVTARRASAKVATTMITDRAAKIAAARKDGPPAWIAGLREFPCRGPFEAIDVDFSTTFDYNQGTYPAGSYFTLALGGAQVPLAKAGARSGQPLSGTTPSGTPRLILTGDTADAGTPNARRYTISLSYPDPLWWDPIDVVGDQALYSPRIAVSFVEQDTSVTPIVTLRNLYLGTGTLSFSRVSRAAGAPVTGSIHSVLY